MLNRTPAITIWMIAVLALGTVAIVQTNAIADRFTFVAANARLAGPSGEGRMEIVVNQWSSDADRDHLMSVLRNEGSDKLWEALLRGPRVGDVRWPGNLAYTIRFARSTPRADGGQDIILATDYPINVWWDKSLAAPPTTFSHGTLIELRMNKDGRGEGKLSMGTKVSAAKDSKTFLLEDYAKQPVILTDVREAATPGAVATSGPQASVPDKAQTVSGCLQRTEAGTYVLTNVDMGSASTQPASKTSGAVGTSGSRVAKLSVIGLIPPGVSLRQFVDHRVEVAGTVKASPSQPGTRAVEIFDVTRLPAKTRPIKAVGGSCK